MCLAGSLDSHGNIVDTKGDLSLKDILKYSNATNKQLEALSRKRDPLLHILL